MAKKKWNKFPHPAKAFDYSGSKLAKAEKLGVPVITEAEFERLIAAPPAAE